MPSRVRDSSPEKKKERKESSKTDRPERKERHRSSAHRRASTKEKSSSRTSISPVDAKRRSSLTATSENDDPIIKTQSRSGIPYPSFSKAHSKEAVGSTPTVNVLTPPATDLDVPKEKSTPFTPIPEIKNPPSPPLTDQNTDRWKSPAGKPVSVETIPEEGRSETLSKTDKTRLRANGPQSTERMRSNSDIGQNTPPIKSQANVRLSTPSKVLETHTRQSQRSVSQPTRTASPVTNGSVTEVGTAISSQATSIAPEQPSIQRPGSKVLPTSATFASSKYTALEARQPFIRNETPKDVILEENESVVSANLETQEMSQPPPPPPLLIPTMVPRVDYLLQNGGLHQSVTKNLLLAGKSTAVLTAASPSMAPIVAANLFEPYNHLLDDFERVISKNGSLAVATGYKSVARRLLDRLEAVFARDLSSESCRCPMCGIDNRGQDVRGVSWGEILELVSGRQELPDWPPFAFVASQTGLGASLDFQTPMTKLDIDVPEEYREHYIRQSRKTKMTVDRWLTRSNDSQSNPPEEVDDETLSFAIMTHLEPEQRQAYKDLLCIVDKPIEPPKRAPSPEHVSIPTPSPSVVQKSRPAYIHFGAIAIQRLYRLQSTPRDPETSIFMVNYPTLHNSLSTLAAVSDDEWEILTSGRFDGFLRSGADESPDVHARFPQQRSTSRGTMTTPAYMNGHYNPNARRSSYSRTNTPATTATPASAQYGAPIAFDEEVEIATLAEIERDIYTSMEKLEDAFETLHLKAEAVRKVLRERSAGLAAAAQRRKSSLNGGFNEIEVRQGTPASNTGFGYGGLGGGMNPGSHGMWDTETDDGLGDWEGVSELAPDDSASNISSSRRRRPKRRNERMTPAAIEEEDDEEAVNGGLGVNGGGGRYYDHDSRGSSPRKR